MRDVDRGLEDRGWEPHYYRDSFTALHTNFRCRNVSCYLGTGGSALRQAVSVFPLTKAMKGEAEFDRASPRPGDVAAWTLPEWELAVRLRRDAVVVEIDGHSKQVGIAPRP